MNRLVGVNEAAELLGVVPPTLYAWCSRGKGPSSFRVLGKVVYDLQVLLDWLERQRAATSRGDGA